MEGAEIFVDTQNFALEVELLFLLLSGAFLSIYVLAFRGAKSPDVVAFTQVSLYVVS